MTTIEEIEETLNETGYVTCYGDVRLGCGHRHRTASGALRCLDDDRRGCRSQGGYSDRRIVPLLHWPYTADEGRDVDGKTYFPAYMTEGKSIEVCHECDRWFFTKPTEFQIVICPECFKKDMR